jgi:hypothetical protein
VQQAFDALAVLGPPRERFGRKAPSPSDKGGQLGRERAGDLRVLPLGLPPAERPSLRRHGRSFKAG